MKILTNSIDPSLLLSTYQKQQQQAKTDGGLGKDAFLKLLIAQMQNQDPLSPMDDKEYIAQMAQFSTLEQLTNISKQLENFFESQQQNSLIAYNQFVGKEITWHKLMFNENDEIVIDEGTGRVAAIQFKNNQVYFILEDGTKLEPANVSQVNATSSENRLAEASMLVGKKVTYLDENNEEKTAIVLSAIFKNGKTLFQLDDELKTNITASQIIKIEK